MGGADSAASPSATRSSTRHPAPLLGRQLPQCCRRRGFAERRLAPGGHEGPGRPGQQGPALPGPWRLSNTPTRAGTADRGAGKRLSAGRGTPESGRVTDRVNVIRNAGRTVGMARHQGQERRGPHETRRDSTRPISRHGRPVTSPSAGADARSAACCAGRSLRDAEGPPPHDCTDAA